MINCSEILIKLEEKISGQSDVCSSGGPVFDFPESMKNGFVNFGIGLIVCHEGNSILYFPENNIMRILARRFSFTKVHSSV